MSFRNLNGVLERIPRDSPAKGTRDILIGRLNWQHNLTRDGRKEEDDGPPMSHRNFPPSFWNSNYQPMPNSNLGPMGPGSLGSLGPELAPFASSYHPGSARFASQYGSLLLQPAVRSPGRLGPAAAACASLEKADSWAASRYHDSLGHVDSNYGAAYGAMTPMTANPSGTSLNCTIELYPEISMVHTECTIPMESDVQSKCPQFETIAEN
ncbi:uncharacterized protein CEXT_230471 [Caerostris extrusa]|uniref:Uncharacterized protein n=1 Tax=Caerostris extrusa TaxID=172846 RepID=A0AAV4U9N9_CAEEX|nr:uncharacterized protein CEXT_230471 [Caerostris extrusa]